MPAFHDYWPMVLKSLKKALSSSIYKAWFSGLEFYSVENNGRKIILQVDSAFQKNYIEKKHKSTLQQCVAQYYPNVIHLDYCIKAKNKDVSENLNQLQIPVQESVFKHFTLHSSDIREAKGMKSIADYLPKRNINNLNPKYTLEQFIINNGNELATSVAKAIIAKPGTAYNPVFIHSDVGLGKTHLIQAIGQKLIEQQPNLRIRYCTLETFFNHYISAVQKNKTNDFRDYYRELDVLLIDDIQFLRGKEGTQDAFFHTFNELYHLNKQIVLTSDKPPKFIDGIEERLISRFESGITIDIQKPDFEGRVAILRSKIEHLRIRLESAHVSTIAGRVNTNIRDLEGVINRIQARMNLLPDKILTKVELDKILDQSDLSGTINLSVITPSKTHPNRNQNQVINSDHETLISTIAAEFNLVYTDLIGDSKQKEVVHARQMAMWIFRNQKKMMIGDIARIFRRNHSTVIHSCKKIDSMNIDQASLEKYKQNYSL